MKQIKRRLLEGILGASLAVFSAGAIKGLEYFADETQAGEVKVEKEENKELKEMIIRHEGKREWVYDDATGNRLKEGDVAKGNRTIGVGFNLDRDGAQEIIASSGLDYNALYNGEECLSDSKINDLLEEDINSAARNAKNYIGETYFESLPSKAKNILINMSFNLGPTRLGKFKRLRTALQKRTYNAAADEMKNSRWYTQTGNRARELTNAMRALDN